MDTSKMSNGDMSPKWFNALPPAYTYNPRAYFPQKIKDIHEHERIIEEYKDKTFFERLSLLFDFYDPDIEYKCVPYPPLLKDTNYVRPRDIELLKMGLSFPDDPDTKYLCSKTIQNLDPHLFVDLIRKDEMIDGILHGEHAAGARRIALTWKVREKKDKEEKTLFELQWPSVEEPKLYTNQSSDGTDNIIGIDSSFIARISYLFQDNPYIEYALVRRHENAIITDNPSQEELQAKDNGYEYIRYSDLLDEYPVYKDIELISKLIKPEEIQHDVFHGDGLVLMWREKSVPIASKEKPSMKITKSSQEILNDAFKKIDKVNMTSVMDSYLKTLFNISESNLQIAQCMRHELNRIIRDYQEGLDDDEA